MEPSSDSGTSVVSETLQESTVHDMWEDRYRSPDRNYRRHLFDLVARQLGDAAAGPVLDAGCGPAVHAIRLAERGFLLHGIDSSPAALELARKNVDRAGYADSITLQQGDLLQLPFPDGTYGRVMCWGVLMHVPQVEEAIRELVRVTAPGGTILISESNIRSIHGRMIRFVKARQSSTVHIDRRPAGLEIWRRTSAGDLFIRVADPAWLTTAFARQGARLVARRPTGLTDLHTRLGPRASRVVQLASHGFFFTRWPGPALGNLFVFEKREA